jgi:L-lactate dehydrogenase
MMADLAPGRTKIAIVGPGNVGVTLAYACLIRGTGKTIALYGRHPDRVRAEVLDLSHGLQFVPMATVAGSDDIEVCRNADILAIAVGTIPQPGQTRLDLAGSAVAICRDLLPRLLQVAPDAIVLLLTNPVDVVTYAALKILGLPASRVLGSGTVLDSSRFRSLIAQHCGVAVQNVHAYIAGEHGDSEIALWTSATVGGVPVLRWDDPVIPALGAAGRDAIVRQVVDAGYEIIRGKGYTNYAAALAGARIMEAILYDEHQVLPVSSLLDGYAGIRDVCLSVPCVVNRTGVQRVLPVPLSDEEKQGLQQSARAVRSAIDKLDLAVAPAGEQVTPHPPRDKSLREDRGGPGAQPQPGRPWRTESDVAEFGPSGGCSRGDRVGVWRSLRRAGVFLTGGSQW